MKAGERIVIRRMKVIVGLSMGILLVGACGIGYSSPPEPKPPSPPNIAPEISYVTPRTVPAGTERQTIIIRGSGFNESCRARLDSEQVETQYGDGGILYAKLGKPQLETPRTAVLQLECPLQSNQIELQIK